MLELYFVIVPSKHLAQLRTLYRRCTCWCACIDSKHAWCCKL